MRLIDADKLEKKWTIASPEPYNTDAAEVLDSIKEAPTVDAVPVVRCKDCRWAKKVEEYEPKYQCLNICRYGCTQWLDSNDFCSYGERSNNELDKR